MKFTDMFRAKAQPVVETKESATAATLVMSPGQAAWSVDTNAKLYAHEAYQKNVIAYRAVSAIAEAIASVPWTAWRGDGEVTQSPLLDLIAQPNPGMSGREYMEAKVSYLMITGNAYEEQVTATGNLPRELYVHRSDRMTVVPGPRGVPIGYVYDINGRKTKWDVDPDTQKSAIMHTKLFNPLDDWYGQSPARAGTYAIDQHNESMAWMQALLQNSARPSGALVMKDGETLSDENYARLKAQTEEQYQGAKNAGRPMLLEGGLEWQAMGASPKDMLALDTKYSAARDIALAWGVPPQLLGIPGDNTYANYAEARLAFWEDTIG
jgi:HK97 family phage portal protein